MSTDANRRYPKLKKECLRPSVPDSGGRPAFGENSPNSRLNYVGLPPARAHSTTANRVQSRSIALSRASKKFVPHLPHERKRSNHPHGRRHRPPVRNMKKMLRNMLLF